MHGDLTTRNILLNARRTKAKIGDLGLSKTLQASAITEATPGGTLAFAAPEVLLNLRCSEKVLPL
jgi:serine/threonine protein kinase